MHLPTLHRTLSAAVIALCAGSGLALAAQPPADAPAPASAAPASPAPYPFDPLVAGKLVHGQIPIKLSEPLRLWNKSRTEAEARFRAIRAAKLHSKATDADRQTALSDLREHLSMPAYRSLIEAFATAPIDDQRLALGLLTEREDDYAQAVIADTALRAGSSNFRTIARQALIDRLKSSINTQSKNVPESVQRVIRAGLRSNVSEVRHDAASIARGLNLINLLPLVIAGQTVGGNSIGSSGPGPALAFIQVGTQQGYVRDLVPVIGNGAAAFDPVPGVLTTGTVLIVDDAVVSTSQGGGIVSGGNPSGPSVAGRHAPPSPFTANTDMVMRGILLAWAKDLTGEDLSRQGARLTPWRTWYEQDLPAALAKHLQPSTDPSISVVPAPLMPWDEAAKLPGHPPK